MTSDIVMPLLIGGIAGLMFCCAMLAWACFIVGARSEQRARAMERLHKPVDDPPARRPRFHVNVENYRKG